MRLLHRYTHNLGAFSPSARSLGVAPADCPMFMTLGWRVRAGFWAEAWTWILSLDVRGKRGKKVKSWTHEMTWPSHAHIDLLGPSWAFASRFPRQLSCDSGPAGCLGPCWAPRTQCQHKTRTINPSSIIQSFSAPRGHPCVLAHWPLPFYHVLHVLTCFAIWVPVLDHQCLMKTMGLWWQYTVLWCP